MRERKARPQPRKIKKQAASGQQQA